MVPVENLIFSRKSRIEKQNPLFCRINRTCWFCKKTFCCKECCDNHMKKQHPNQKANCALCSSQILPLRQFVFEGLPLEDEKLLCHIVNKHLPLRCTLCGDLFKTEEDFKSFGSCKWYAEYHQLMFERLSSPATPGLKSLEVSKLKENYSNSYNYGITTPPEIYRNTSTPMFSSQKNDFEYQMPCMPNFSLKTPKTESSMIGQTDVTSNSYDSQQNTKFISFSSILENEEATPFRNNNDEQFVKNNLSKLEIRKLDIKRELDDTTYNEEIELYEEPVTSPVDMDLTNVQGSILPDSPKLNIIHEEPSETSSIMKKVRFSDQGETLPEIEAESIATNISNVTEEEEVFHDAHDALHAKNTEDIKMSPEDTKTTEIMKNVLSTKNTKDDQALIARDSLETSSENDSLTNSPENFSANSPKHPPMNSSKNSLDNSQNKIFRDNEKNAEKENRSEEVLVNVSSTVNQQGASRVLMMVLVENNAGGSSNDLTSLINLGLKKMEDQISSGSSSDTAETSSAASSSGYTRRSITKMQMNISRVENYSSNNANEQQIVTHSSPSSAEGCKNDSGGGILSIFTQAVKYAFKNLSGMATGSVEKTQINQRREIVEEESLPGSSTSSTTSNLDKNLEIRSGKRGHDTLALEVRSPMAKRQKGLYKIKGRKPISRMRNDNNRMTSSRGISSETQIFKQGSLTVGDTILPLPARAYQLTKKE